MPIFQILNNIQYNEIVLSILEYRMSALYFYNGNFLYSEIDNLKCNLFYFKDSKICI